MGEMIPNNPINKYLNVDFKNWIQFLLALPVVFYSCWMFFQKAWTSFKTRNLNMFSLIGLGAGAAFIFSIVALIFPSVFPEQFRNMDGSVFLYFEAVTVILTLVLLVGAVFLVAYWCGAFQAQERLLIFPLLLCAPTLHVALQMGNAVALWAGTDAANIKLKKSGVKQILNLMGEPLPLAGGNAEINLKLKPGYPIFVLGRVEPIGQAVLADDEKTSDTIRF